MTASFAQRQHHSAAPSALCEPRPSTPSSTSPSASPSSPLFRQPPAPPSISLSHILPPRSNPSLHPLLVVVIARHGARSPVNYEDGQSPEAFTALWGQCHQIDSDAKLSRDARKIEGRESDAQLPFELPSDADAPQQETLAPCGRGQLTQTGEHQLRSIGEALRRQYVDQDHFLPPTLTSPDLLQLCSSNMSRTRLSLARMMQGLYPELGLQAIRAMTEVRAEEVEDLYPPFRFCDRLRQIFHNAASNPLYTQYLDTPDLHSLHNQAVATLAGPGFDPKAFGAQNRSWSQTRPATSSFTASPYPTNLLPSPSPSPSSCVQLPWLTPSSAVRPRVCRTSEE